MSQIMQSDIKNKLQYILSKIKFFQTGEANKKQEWWARKYVKLGELKNILFLLERYPHLKKIRGKALRKKGARFEIRVRNWFNSNIQYQGLCIRTPITKFEKQISDLVMYIKDTAPIFIQCKTSGLKTLKNLKNKLVLTSRVFKTTLENKKLIEFINYVKPYYLVCIPYDETSFLCFDIAQILNKTQLLDNYIKFEWSKKYTLDEIYLLWK